VGCRRNVIVKVPSTAPSPVFSELAIVLGDNEIFDSLPDVTLLETLHAVKEVRPFKFVFSPDILSPA